MIKSFSQLKRDLLPGTQLKVLEHKYRPEQIGNIKTISRTQSNGLYTTSPDDREGKEIWLELPSASLVTYDDNIISFYGVGCRDLNEQEKAFLLARSKEWETRPYDNPYFISLSLAKKMGVEYMENETSSKRYSHYDNKVYDKAIKGDKLISFEIISKGDNE
jgi:hypothetical protein